MNQFAKSFAEHAKSRGFRAESADRVAPILPPASPSQINTREIVAVGSEMPAVRIAKRGRRLRMSLRPAAQTWPRRAARRLLSPAITPRSSETVLRFSAVGSEAEVRVADKNRRGDA